MRSINLIVIHCAATPNGKSLFRGLADGTGLQVTPVQQIDRDHGDRKPPFHRDPAWIARFNPELAHIGYHFVVYTNGVAATGRHPDEVGAHVAGHNANSIGVCMIGTDHFTADQWRGLADLVAGLLKKYPNARVVGHRDLSPDLNHDGTIEPREWIKICPGFTVADWIKGGMAPLTDHLFKEEA